LYNFAVIVTHNRPELLKQCVDAIRPQVHQILVIDNRSDPPVPKDEDYAVCYEPTDPVNMSKFWNIAIDYFAYLSDTSEWNIAFLCDDVTVPDGWFHAVETCMRKYNGAAGSTHQYSPTPIPILKTAPDNDIFNRMCGWAFIVAGEKGLRADESMKWWFCDTDMDWQARKNGGMVVCPGPVAKNIRPNDFTYSVPGLAEQTGIDGLAFAAKWGGRPW
jgi:glycosyltransferase involved in cell wall biosynthesis